MKKYAVVLTTLLSLSAMSLIISSCKDDEPPAKPVVSFDDDTQVAQEAAGIVDVLVKLDKPASKDLTISYTVTGTAVDLEAAPNVAASDYSIVGGTGELDIAKGESSGTIQIDLRSDTSYEGDETIEIELDDAGEDATISAEKSSIVFTIKDDDTKPTITFASGTMTVNEADGIVEIPVTISSPVSQNINVQFTLGGEATDSVASVASETSEQYKPADYSVIGTQGSFTIKANATSGVIRLGLYTDFYFEPEAETITLTLTAPTNVDLGTSAAITINLEQQDGLIAELHWNDDNTANDIDMDMFLWLMSGNNKQLYAFSSYGSVEDPEQIFVPSVVTDGLSVGMSYVYYEGTADPMNFTVLFADYKEGQVEPEANFETFNGTYTLANIHAWEKFSDITLIEQTFAKVGSEFTNFSAITTPATSSRMKPMLVTPTKLKQTGKETRSSIQRLIKR
jgi:hypothetical protein